MIDYNNYFYLKKHNQNKVNRILRFYQSTISVSELLEESKNDGYSDMKTNFNIPDLSINRIPFSQITGDIKMIVEELVRFELPKEMVYFLPILIIKNSDCISSGIYCIDYNKKYLIKYKEIDYKQWGLKCLKDDFDIGISYFLDINMAVMDKGESGFIEGILQIGRVMEHMDTTADKIDLRFYNLLVPQQAFTHGLGLNCRSILYISNQFVRRER
jgi:hypothetical protein